MDKLTLILHFSFGVSLITQCYFWIVIFKRASIPDTQKTINTDNKQISIIVCALNEYKNLCNLIPKLLDQKYNDFEVIIINDRSTDQTLNLLRSVKDSRFSFLTINTTPHGIDHKKYALQKGIKKAKFEFVLLTDADCIPNSDEWVYEMQKSLSNKEIVLGLSFYEKRDSFINKFIQYETFYTAVQYIGFSHFGKPYMGVGRNLLYKKELFIKNTEFKKFKSHIGGDDDLVLQQFMSSKNTTTALAWISQTTSIPKENYKEWFSQKKRHLSAGTKYPKIIKRYLAALHISHFTFYLIVFFSFYYVDILLFTLVGYLLRTLIIFSIFGSVSKRFGNQLTKKEIIQGDILYMIYFFITGIFTLYTKKSKWK